LSGIARTVFGGSLSPLVLGKKLVKMPQGKRRVSSRSSNAVIARLDRAIQ
jgi:hypothetical protein